MKCKFVRYFDRISPTGSDPTNLLLTGSLAGACLYIYDRKHLKSLGRGRQKVGFRYLAKKTFLHVQILI